MSVFRINAHVQPEQVVSAANYKLEDIPSGTLPAEVADGNLRLKLTHISIDPWYLGLVKPGLYSWCNPLPVGAPMMGTVVATVTAVGKDNDKFKVGDTVSGFLPFQTIQDHNGDGLNSLHGAEPSAALSIFGGPALTAYFGLEDVAQPKEGDVVVVSAAAGSVGTIVSQLCKAKGCTVIGFAGSDEKCTHLVNTVKIDTAINYKAADWKDQLAKAVGDKKVNIYWDNTAGEIADAVYPLMADHGRVVLCGEISSYADSSAKSTALSHGAVNHLMLEKRLRVEGILVSEYFPRMMDAMPTLMKLHGEGKLTANTHLVQGFENTVTAFLGLFEGKNVGKTIVVV